MKSYRAFHLLALFFFTGYLYSQTLPDSAIFAEAKTSIDKGNQEWIAGFETGDPDRVAAIFAEDGMMFGSKGRTFKGKAALTERIRLIMEHYGSDLKVTVSTLQIWVAGDVAYETGEYAYHYSKEGNQQTVAGTYCTMWRRQDDGKWKLVLDIPVK